MSRGNGTGPPSSEWTQLHGPSETNSSPPVLREVPRVRLGSATSCTLTSVCHVATTNKNALCFHRQHMTLIFVHSSKASLQKLGYVSTWPGAEPLLSQAAAVFDLKYQTDRDGLQPSLGARSAAISWKDLAPAVPSPCPGVHRIR